MCMYVCMYVSVHCSLINTRRIHSYRSSELLIHTRPSPTGQDMQKRAALQPYVNAMRKLLTTSEDLQRSPEP